MHKQEPLPEGTVDLDRSDCRRDGDRRGVEDGALVRPQLLEGGLVEMERAAHRDGCPSGRDEEGQWRRVDGGAREAAASQRERLPEGSRGRRVLPMPRWRRLREVLCYGLGRCMAGELYSTAL